LIDKLNEIFLFLYSGFTAFFTQFRNFFYDYIY